jgi:hypothetical protein
MLDLGSAYLGGGPVAVAIWMDCLASELGTNYHRALRTCGLQPTRAALLCARVFYEFFSYRQNFLLIATFLMYVGKNLKDMNYYDFDLPLYPAPGDFGRRLPVIVNI